MNNGKYIRILLLFCLMLLFSVTAQADDGLRVANLNIHADPVNDIYPNYVGTNPAFHPSKNCCFGHYPYDFGVYQDWELIYVGHDEKTGNQIIYSDPYWLDHCKTPATCMNQAVQTCKEKASNNDVVFRTCMWDVLDTATTNHFQSICTAAGYSSLSDCLSVISNQNLLNNILASCADVCKSSSSGCSACFLEKINEEKEKAAEEICTAYCRDSADPDCLEDCIKLIDEEGITVIKQPEAPAVPDIPELSEEILQDILELAENNMLGTKTYEAAYYHFPTVMISDPNHWFWEFFGSESNFIVHFAMEWEPDESDSDNFSCGVFGRWSDGDMVTMSMDRSGWAEIKSTVKGSSYFNNSGNFVRTADKTPSSFTVGLVEQNASIVYNGNLTTYSKNITLNSGSWGLMQLTGRNSRCSYGSIEILVLE